MYKVIIVEDDLMVTEINKTYVSRNTQVKVIQTFANGQSALDYLSNHSVDLIILDLYMPVISGLELLDMIRQKKYDTDAIMVTAANDSLSIDKALKLGIVDYLVKPFKYDRFKIAIDKFINKRKLLENKSAFSQSSIDSLINSNSSFNLERDELLYKGLQKETLNLIRNYMISKNSMYLTSEEISNAINLSKVTIRRYMNYLIDSHEVISNVDYRTGGRPSIKYKFL